MPRCRGRYHQQMDNQITAADVVDMIRDALAWTPDDTATAGAATGDE